LSHQEKLQEKYTGGTVFHGFLGESIVDPKVVKSLIKIVLTSYKVPYFNITPTFSICESHGYLKGEHSNCPKCGKSALVYSRVVGYFRPTNNYNIGKLDEFNKRTLYDNDVSKF
jgi:ribonucleoside-triphosphate reductase